MPELISVKEATVAFSISRATLLRWLREGQPKRYEQASKHVTLVDLRGLARLPRPVKSGS
jgi:predicted site-specific integrase-resolvase